MSSQYDTAREGIADEGVRDIFLCGLVARSAWPGNTARIYRHFFLAGRVRAGPGRAGSGGPVQAGAGCYR
jgi:hypothetical protein